MYCYNKRTCTPKAIPICSLLQCFMEVWRLCLFGDNCCRILSTGIEIHLKCFLSKPTCARPAKIFHTTFKPRVFVVYKTAMAIEYMYALRSSAKFAQTIIQEMKTYPDGLNLWTTLKIYARSYKLNGSFITLI